MVNFFDRSTTPITLERILERKTLRKHLGRWSATKGGAGVDGMKTLQLRCYILEHPNEISEAVRNGTYTPKPIFRKRAKRVPLKSEYAYSSNRYWTMSMTPVIHRILSNKRLLSEGWATLEQFAWKG